MERHFDKDLSEFHNDLLKMAALVEQSIDASIDALKKQNKTLACKTVEDDSIIDEMENLIMEQGIDLLARYQPMAIDLRYITTGMTIAAELERIADLSVNICQKVLEVADMPLVKPLVDTPKLGRIAKRMVKQAIDCFVNRDERLAQEVIYSDEESDQLRNSIMKELIHEYMEKDGATAPRAVPLLLVARDLERICDHASSIAEDVIYMIKAKIVKHHPERLDNNHHNP